MATRMILIAAGLVAATSLQAIAEEGHKAEHGGQVFHSFRLEADTGTGPEGAVSSADLSGWIGTDEDRLWIKGEFERSGGEIEQSEIWAMYSRNVSDFWDVQVGIRHDFDPIPVTYAVIGIEGLAPFFVETEAHFFVSDGGDVSFRFRREHDLLLTQRLVMQPYAEVELHAQDVPEQEVAAGVSKVEIGLQTRYEIDRDFAPYVDLRYEAKLGETGRMAKEDGGSRGGISALAGIRISF
jgi:copper resistance protein B